VSGRDVLTALVTLLAITAWCLVAILIHEL